MKAMDIVIFTATVGAAIGLLIVGLRRRLDYLECLAGSVAESANRLACRAQERAPVKGRKRA